MFFMGRCLLGIRTWRLGDDWAVGAQRLGCFGGSQPSIPAPKGSRALLDHVFICFLSCPHDQLVELLQSLAQPTIRAFFFFFLFLFG